MNQINQASTLTVPPEVLAFAEEQGVSAYLPAVLAMTQRLFPDARRMAVLVEDDPEIANDRHIVLEVDVCGLDPAGYVEVDWRWGRELFQICPAPVVCVFRLGLEIVEP